MLLDSGKSGRMKAMTKSLLRWAFAWWALACASALAQLPGDIMLPTNSPPARKKRPALPDQLPEKPTLVPVVVVAGRPLGFTSPSSIYLGRRHSLVSLDFIDEQHLLFSFREPGLLERSPAGDDQGLERRIRAVVLSLPEGKVETQSSWTIPDRTRYLWMLGDGHFLLKNRDGLALGDAALKLQPLLTFPSQLQSFVLDPEQKIIMASIDEAPESSKPAGETAVSRAAQSTTGVKPQGSAGLDNLTVRIIDRQSLQTIHTLHSRAAIDAPINDEGYVDAAPGKKYQWSVSFHSFGGGSRLLQKLESGCPPAMGFVSDQALVVTSCTPDAMLRIAAIASLDGHTIWEFTAPPEVVWPLLVPSLNGTRFARVSMVLKPGVNPKDRPRFADAVQGQIVRVFDLGNDSPIFEAPITPALDGGGNVSFSPSGERMALINGDSVEVFNLPAPAQ